MKRTLRNLLVITLVLALSLCGTVVAFADTAGTGSSGIKVQYNGQNITFTDAVPQIVNGRTMVPFRQILETMGATVTYDQKTKTVVAVKPEMEFSFVIGGTDITIKKDGNTTVKKMDVAPFIDKKTNRTYVPARFMAESMNYGVSWDNFAKTAVIIDPASLFSEADKDFSIISKLLTMEVDLEKSYETSGSFQADVTTYAAAAGMSDMSFSISGDMKGVQLKTDADMVMNMMLNVDKALASMTPEEQAQMKPLLDAFKNINMKIKMDGDSGEMYMNSNLFSTMDPTIDANTWFKMNMFETYDQMGIDLRPLMDMSKSQYSISEMLQTIVQGMNTGDVNSYKDMKTVYAFMKNLIGNEAFKSSTAGSITTHTLNLDKNDLLAALAKTALDEGAQFDSADTAEFTEAVKGIEMSTDIIIKEKEGKLYNYNMKGAFSFEGITASMSLIGDTLNADVEMTIDQPNMMKMSIKADSTYIVTTKTPDLELPAGAKVLDYNTYFMPSK